MSNSCPANELDYIEQLRERGLHRLAEVECRRRLAAPGVGPREEARLVGQLSLIEVDRAFDAPLAESIQHWQAAEAVIVDFLDQRPAHPARVLLELQEALNSYERGSAERLFEAAGRRIPTGNAALHLREATKVLQRLAEEVRQLSRRTGDESSDLFTAAELDSLGNRIELATSTALVELAICHDSGSPDFDDALLRAEAITGKLTGRALPSMPLWRARLLHTKVQRLLGNASAAREQFEGWLAEGRAESPESEVEAELARLLLAEGDSEGLRTWRDNLRAELLASADVELVLLETESAAWESMQPGAAKNRALLAVQSAVARIARDHGPRWALRAEAAARGALESDAKDASLETTVARAELLYGSGRHDKAIEAYDRAAAMAFQSGAKGRAFELALAAAAIEHTRRHWSEASQRFRRAALASAAHPQAPRAHHQASVCYAQTLRSGDEPSRSRGWQEYLRILKEHLDTWPTSTTASEVRWWRVSSLAALAQWEAVAESAAEVPPEDPFFPEAVRLLGDAWNAHYQQRRLANADEEANRVAEEGVKQLQAIVLIDGRWPQPWSAAQRSAALAAARLRLASTHGEAGADYATRMLRAASNAAPPPDDAWKSAAAPLLAAASVRRGDFLAATKAMADHPTQSRASADPLLRELRGELTSDRDNGAGELALVVLRSIPASEDGAWRWRLDALAYQATGQAEQALAAAKKLVDQSPEDTQAKRLLAGMLATRPGETDRVAALELYRWLESRGRKGTTGWFEDRLQRLRVMASLGQVEQADKLLRLTRVLYPELGGRAAEFDEVESLLARERN